MNTISTTTESKLIDVELMSTHNILESTSVTTFMPEEEASICPLLSSNTNSITIPPTLSHPMTLYNNNKVTDNNSSDSLHRLGEGQLVDSSSSSGSSSGIAINVSEDVSNNFFNKQTSYKHLQPNNTAIINEESIGPNCINGVFQMGVNTPSFVAWNWPLIRKCTFFTFVSALLAMCTAVVAMIASLPQTCNPKTAWYHGGVFYEIFPASFQDTNNDGIGDLQGIIKRLDYLSDLGVSGIRLNSIFSSPLYPEDYVNMTSLYSIAPVLGNETDLQQLITDLHKRNISLMLDLPVYALKLLDRTDPPTISNLFNETSVFNDGFTNFQNSSSNIDKHFITEALKYWIKMNVDGFYIKGIEHLSDVHLLPYYLKEWKDIIGLNRVLIVNENILNILDGKNPSLWEPIDLVDVYLETSNHSMKFIQDRIQHVINSEIGPSGSTGVWIHWTVNGENYNRLTSSYYNEKENYKGQYILAITLIQLMLPGTPSIFYGDEIAIHPAEEPYQKYHTNRHLKQLSIMKFNIPSKESFNSASKLYRPSPKTLPWMPTSTTVQFENLPVITSMITLRNRSPSIYKNAICKQNSALSNTIVKQPRVINNENIMIIERVYPRRNTFVAICNLGMQSTNIDLSSIYYSGVIQLDESLSKNKIYFNEFVIQARQTMIIKLDK